MQIFIGFFEFLDIYPAPSLLAKLSESRAGVQLLTLYLPTFDGWYDDSSDLNSRSRCFWQLEPPPCHTHNISTRGDCRG